MVSALDSGASASGSNPRGGRCVAFLGKTFLPLSTQVYKWVPANLMLGVTLRSTSIPSRGGGGGVEILPVASCYRNRNKLRPNGPLGSNAHFTLRVGLRIILTSPSPSDCALVYSVCSWHRFYKI